MTGFRIEPHSRDVRQTTGKLALAEYTTPELSGFGIASNVIASAALVLVLSSCLMFGLLGQNTHSPGYRKPKSLQALPP